MDWFWIIIFWLHFMSTRLAIRKKSRVVTGGLLRREWNFISYHCSLVRMAVCPSWYLENQQDRWIQGRQLCCVLDTCWVFPYHLSSQTYDGRYYSAIKALFGSRMRVVANEAAASLYHIKPVLAFFSRIIYQEPSAVITAFIKHFKAIHAANI